MKINLSKKNYVISAGADGLGFAVSKAFSEKKANLFLLDIDHKKLTENIRTNYLSQINNFENNMLISFPQAVVLTQLDRITENTIKEMNFVRAPVLIIFSLLGIFSSTLLIMFSYLII